MGEQPGVTGIVLAGGRSSRFGSDKAAAMLEGRPLLDWVASALAEVSALPVLVVAAPSQLLPPLSAPFKRLDDRWPGEGPLGGIVTGLGRAAHGIAFVAACDSPLLDAKAIATVVAALVETPDADLAVPITGGRRQPLAAAYRAAVCLPALERSFVSGERSVLRAIEPLRALEVHGFDGPASPLRQANTPADLESLASDLRARRRSGTTPRG